MTEFEVESAERIEAIGRDDKLALASAAFMRASFLRQYSYNFFWTGRPVIQYPQDLVALQEIIWRTRPDVVVETGIAHGGSLVFSASMLALLDYADAVQSGELLDPARPRRRVIGVDIDIRPHNRSEILKHAMASRITMIEGSSIEPSITERVRQEVGAARKVLVCLDSMHTHDHVIGELNAYAPLVTPGSYCIVFDTIVEDLPNDVFSNRPWGAGNNPKTAVHDWLAENSGFEIDHSIATKLQLTCAPDGFLRRK
jgi:cephalosporin hydroxylase